ncbi:MAG: hypothetical protein M3258_03430 [Thermoproteota archaeon]|jgi:hypothetical protein|nr:hypothetical protein [Thermoproteota archaeon]
MKLKLEDWSSLGSLALSVMFVALLLSFYTFLIGPQGSGPQQVVEPGSLLLQLIFISVAPSLVLAGVAFVLSKTYGSAVGGGALIASGLILIVGMAIGVTMIPRIQAQYIVGGAGAAPYIFMPAGVGVVAVGGYMLAISQTRTRSRRAHVTSRDMDDLR